MSQQDAALGHHLDQVTDVGFYDSPRHSLGKKLVLFCASGELPCAIDRNVSGAIPTFDVPDGSSSVPPRTEPNPPVSLAVHLGAQIARCSDVAK
jgi:hypothetical protein